MKRFVIRKNCEYSIEVEAEDQGAALRQADATKDEDWSQAWSPFEFDEDESELN